MNIIDQHIRKHLHHFQDEEDASFQEIFELIQSEVKNDYNSLLRYIHFLLDEAFLDEKTDSKSHHLHFDYNFDDVSLFVIHIVFVSLTIVSICFVHSVFLTIFEPISIFSKSERAFPQL